MKTIRLYGRLRRLFGAKFELDVASPAEAIRALVMMVPGFREEVEKGAYRFVRGSKETGFALNEQALHLGLGKTSEMHLIPATANRKGLGKVILGAALIAASFFIPGLGAVAAGMIRSVGLSLALAGVSMMLTPMPPKPKDGKKEDSFIFSGADNTTAQGGPVPLVYGLVMAGSVVISAGLSTEELAIRSGTSFGGAFGAFLHAIAAQSSDGLTETDLGWGSVNRESLDNYVRVLKGGKGGGSPSEAPNSLRSNQTARLVDLISEGPCVGLANTDNPLKSVFFDDVQVQNDDGTFNFKGLVLEQRVGNPSDTPIPGFSSAESEVAVSSKVTTTTPIVRAISDTNVNDCRVTLRVPQLMQIDDEGNINATRVRFAIDVSANGGGYQTIINTQISGKTNSEYQRAYRFGLPGTGPWNIRVRRLTADSTSSKLSNDIYWDSYTEIVNAKLFYPNSAIIGIEADAQQFGTNIPRRGYLWMGRIISVPANYDPIRRTYATSGTGTSGGVWDGTFKQAWSNNPAWVLYDILTSTRYGLGNDVDQATPNKWALYEIGQYCDGFLTAGADSLGVSGITSASGVATVTTAAAHGLKMGDYVDIQGADQAEYNGTVFVTATPSQSSFTFDVTGAPASPATGAALTGEKMVPRYAINTQIKDRGEAWELLQNMVSVFRGMYYWGSGQVEFSYDHDEPPSKLVTRANVVDGKLNYSSDSWRGRHSAVVVAWNDPELNYRINYEVIEDPDLIAKLGYKQLETTAWACTSRAQAHRFGKWILDTEKYGELLSYKASLDHANVRPGTVIEVNDPEYTATRRGGRLSVGSTTTVLQLDSPLEKSSGGSVRVMLPDGTVEQRNVTTGVGPVSALTVDTAFSQVPAADAIWSYTEPGVENRLFRVVGVKESSPLEFEITAMWHDPNKFPRVESDLDLPPNTFSDIATGHLVEPYTLDMIDTLVREGDATRPGALVSWSAKDDPRVTYFQYQVKRSEDDDWGTFNETTTTSAIVSGTITAGSWDVRVRSANQSGMRSRWVVKSNVALDGTGGPLPAVTGLAVNTDTNTGIASLNWNAQPVTELRPIRWEILFDEVSTNIADAITVGTTATLQWPISQLGNYFVRATFGTTAPGAASMITVQQSDVPLATVISGPIQSTTFKFSYTLVPESGEFSRDLSFKLMNASGQVMSGVVWSYMVVSGGVNGLTPASPVQAMTGGGTGILTVNSLESSAKVQVTATYQGVDTVALTELTQSIAATPVSGGGGPATLVSKTSGFTGISSSTFTDITGSLHGVMPSGVTAVSINVSLSARPSAGTSGSWTVEFRVMRNISGTWTQIGATRSDGSYYVPASGGEPADWDTGDTTFSQADTGLTGGGAYDWRVECRLTSGARSHSVTGSVSVTT